MPTLTWSKGLIWSESWENISASWVCLLTCPSGSETWFFMQSFFNWHLELFQCDAPWSESWEKIFLQVGFVCWYVQSKWQWNLIFHAKLLQLTSRVGLILWCWSFINYFQELSLQNFLKAFCIFSLSYTLHMHCKNFGIVSLQLLQVHCKILGENFILVETLQTRVFRVIPQPL